MFKPEPEKAPLPIFAVLLYACFVLAGILSAWYTVWYIAALAVRRGLGL